MVSPSYEFTAQKVTYSFNPSPLGMEHDRMYKQDIHNALRYFAPNIFLNFIPDKKRIHPSKADAPTLQSKNLPNTSALYCGRKIVLSILCLIKGLDVKKTTVPAGYTYALVYRWPKSLYGKRQSMNSMFYPVSYPPN